MSITVGRRSNPLARRSETSQSPRRRDGKRSFAPLITVVTIIVVWWAYVAISGVQKTLFPSPPDVVTAWIEIARSGVLWEALKSTLGMLVQGVSIGIAIAAVLSAIAVFQPWARSGLRTLSAMFNPLPAVALLPMALVWFGIGQTPIVFVIVYSVVWVMALNLNAGFESVPVQLRWVGQNLGLGGLGYLWQVFLPAALPHIMTGFRIAWAYGWRTVIAAELVFGAIGGKGGLGYLITVARYNLRSDQVFAVLLTIIAVGLLVEVALSRVEARTVRRWGMAE